MTANENRKMNADEDYGFDVAGFIHVPRVLTAAEVAACSAAIDAVGAALGVLGDVAGVLGTLGMSPLSINSTFFAVSVVVLSAATVFCPAVVGGVS